MKIDNEFTVSAPIEQAWAVLTDLEGIAPCMPGAVLTGREGDAFTGKVKIKVGPVTSEYAGTATFAEKDETAHRAVIDAKGRDSRGAGNATAIITAQLQAEGDRTVVTVSTDLKITGKIAQFGSGMIQEVSKKLLGQFVACLETKLVAAPADQPSSAPEPAVTATEPTAPPVAAQPEPAAAMPQPSAAQPQPSAAQPHEPEALDILALSRGAVAKRAVPLLVGVVVVAIVIYLIVR
jgi:carbon monoxide dehydrogenase subunit G